MQMKLKKQHPPPPKKKQKKNKKNEQTNLSKACNTINIMSEFFKQSRMFETQKSGNNTSSEEIGLNDFVVRFDSFVMLTVQFSQLNSSVDFVLIIFVALVNASP